MNEKEKRIVKAVIECWARGLTPTQRRIASLTKTETKKPLNQDAVRRYLTRWEAEGLMETQKGRNGIGGAAWRFNWFGAASDSGLQEVLQLAFAQDGLPEAAQRHVRTACRKVLKLQDQCPDETIIAAAKAVDAEALHRLPKRVMEAALEAGNGSATAANLRGAVRRSLKSAAKDGVVPVVFPRAWEDDPWEIATWRYFPVGAPGISESTVRTYRTHWRALGREAKELFGLDFSPDGLTQERVKKLQRHLIQKKGLRYLSRQIHTVLSYVGKHHGAGPAAARFIDEDVTIGYNGRTVSDYLVGPNGEAASDADWKGLIRIFRHNGFGREWRRFLLWYWWYSTLPERVLAKHEDRFPVRPPIRLLSPRTQVKRIIALRAAGFQMVQAARDIDGILPIDVTPEQAFGEYGVPVLRRLRIWWEDRAARGEVSHAASHGITDIVKSVMMVARALYDRHRFERGRDPGSSPHASRAARIVDVEAEAKDPVEDRLWNTYINGQAMLKTLEEERAHSDRGHVGTTLKDIKNMMKNTPPSYWSDLQDELLRRVREGHDADSDDFRFHRTVLLTFLLGLMISTGFRIGETTHVRIGDDREGRPRQYGSDNRRSRWIKLRPKDRKYPRNQTAFLRERYCPQWLESLYLERSRPFFLKRGGQDHDWLLVDAAGRPYGCPEEKEDGSGRDELAHAVRVAALRNFWIDQLMGIAVDLGKTIPLEWGEFAPHAIRNVFGYLLFQTRDAKTAANYLGDLERSVEETYAAVDGAHIDISESDLNSVAMIREEVAFGAPDSGKLQKSPARGAVYTEEEMQAEAERLAQQLVKAALKGVLGKQAA